jgi:hypothetical protein
MRQYVALAAFLQLAVVAPLAAATVTFKTNAQLIAESPRVVLARVIGQRYVREDDATIHTVTKLAVLEDFTGRPADDIEVWELGGYAGGEYLHVDGAPSFTVGENVVLCLELGPHGYRSVAMNYSVFHVENGPAGTRLVRDLRGLKLEGGQAVPLTLQAFRALAAQVLGRPSVLRTAELPDPQDEIAFTFLPFGPPRWKEADSGTPIKYYRNTTGAMPIAGDGSTQFQTAMATWTNPPDAKVILQYAGTTSQSAPRGPFTGLSGPTVVVTFDDPNSELSTDTIALAGGVFIPDDTNVASGVTFRKFTRAYVIWQKNATLAANFKTDPDFTRVLAHEVGHTIGLGHTQTDGSIANPESQLMYATCCSPTIPIPPALGPDDLAGLVFIYPTVSATVLLDKDHLNFGATMNGAAFVAQTTAQIVRMTQTGAGVVTWTAVSNVPWVQVSPASGTGPQPLSFTVSSVPGLPIGTTLDGAVTVTFTGSSPATQTVAIRLTTIPNGTSLPPFGTVDTPVDGTTGITGATPVTGWALDDTEVASVAICRDPAGGEPTVPDSRCMGRGQYFLGYAVFIDNARPDVDAAYPLFPRSTRGGWGFMVLTNMLPLQGNGTYRFSAYALDNEGFQFNLGNRTIGVTNATATKPFGTIDTPGQGEVVSGNAYVNFGWALTQNPKHIPFDGSTMVVYVDGVAIGQPAYNFFRSDIATFFPGLANTDGAVGYYVLDTTKYPNGLHTIVWTATDSAGESDGLGSRYFNIANAFTAASSTGTGELAVKAANATTADTLDAVSPDTSPIAGRRGWNADAPLRNYKSDDKGVTLVRGEELDRFELRLDAKAGGRFAGFLRVGRDLRPLPVGSNLDASTGVFTWSPGVGFIGAYNLVFVEYVGDDPVLRHEVRILIGPKGSNQVGPRVVIDTPRRQQDVGQPFVLAGWAADFGSKDDTGIDAIHVWAYPLKGGAPIFVGTAATGGARPDVAAVHGAQFENTGYGIYVQNLEPGNYDLAVFGHSSVTGEFAPAAVVRVTVR